MKSYFLAALFSLLLPAFASAATLSLGGPTGATVGGTFNVPVYLSTAGGESANAVSGTVTFPSDTLSLVAISKAGSIITLWPSEPSQEAGSMHFEGVVLNPGYSGQGGTVVTLTFQAKASGSAALAFQDASVLANDGNATPILSNAYPKTITIQGQQPSTPATGIVITSSTHPNQNATYPQPDVSLSWTLDPNATSVRIGYDKDPQGRPTVVYDASTTHKTITLKDGTWYFHVQDMVNGVWSAVASYRVKISANAPTPPAEVTPVETPSIPSTTTTTPEVGTTITPEIIPRLPSVYSQAYDFINSNGVLVGVILALLLALVLLGRFIFTYPLIPVRTLRRYRRVPGRTALHEQFDELHDAVQEELLALQQVKTRRQLTDEEERFMTRFEKMLGKVERAAELEIKSE